MTSIFYIAAGLFGLVMGSFAGATVWRLRARQLLADEADGEVVDKAELKRLKPLTIASLRKDRSQCLHCHHELAWYDLLPLVSWLSTWGKCRYCHQPIGRFEPFIEIGSAAAFVLLFQHLTQGGIAGAWLSLILYGVMLVLLIILFAYDLKWFLLPDVIMMPLIGIGVFVATWNVIQSAEPVAAMLTIFGSVLILGGLYSSLWLFSKGAWVGFGDVKLGLALGLLLSDWQLAFLTLFLANFIGTLLVLPGLLTKKLDRKAHVPFGPLLVAGFFIAFLYGSNIITGYLQLSSGLTTMMFML